MCIDERDVTSSKEETARSGGERLLIRESEEATVSE